MTRSLSRLLRVCEEFQNGWIKTFSLWNQEEPDGESALKGFELIEGVKVGVPNFRIHRTRANEDRGRTDGRRNCLQE